MTIYRTLTHCTRLLSLPVLVLLLVLALVLTACGREERAMPGADNALLDFVPADTPYLAANLERVPEAIADAYLERARPVLDELQVQLTDLRSNLESESRTDHDDAFEARLPLAILRELDGKLSRQGLSSLGIDILAYKVVYGMGAFPVFRTGLSDPAALRATIQRVLDNAGLAAPEQSLQGVAYWRATPDGGGDSDAPVGLYISILQDHLAIGILPVAKEADLLPAFLGLERPAASDARSRLAELDRANGYTHYGSAIVDLRRLADEFLNPDSLTAGVMAELGAYDPVDITQECRAELNGIIDTVPRVTAGTTELDADAVAYQYRLETPPTLASRLMDLVARIPPADPSSGRMLDLAFGMRFGAVRDFLREKAEAVVQNPYRCEHLQELNSRAEEALAKLNQPMPPFVNNFRGLRVSLDEILVDAGGLPSGARGLLALHVEQPEMFLGMAQMFLPNLANLGLEAGGPPVRLPEDLFPVPGMVAYAATTNDAIGISVGEGEEDSLADYLDRDEGPKGMFLSVNYDTAAYLEYTEHLAEGKAFEASYESGTDRAAASMPDRPHDGAHALAEAAQSAFRSMADRSLTTLQFAPDGLVIDGRMTFKPLP